MCRRGSACIACTDVAIAHTAPVTVNKDYATFHMEVAISHEEDTVAHTEDSVVHIEIAIARIAPTTA